MPPRRVTVYAPATTANLGPGFDCLGMALDFGNTITLEQADALQIDVHGEGSKELTDPNCNRVFHAVAAAYGRMREPIPPLRLSSQNLVPLCRGLGSSAAAAIAGLLAANALLGDALTQDDILLLATEMEGHPDNVAPALLGGCQVAVRADGRIVTAPLPLLAGLRVALYIPDFQMPTAQARALLADAVPREDAVFNLGRAALLVAALAGDRPDLLRLATQDRLHQPARTRLFPAMPLIIEAATDAGAHGAFLSGGGSAIAALAEESQAQAVAMAMRQAGERAGLRGVTRVCRPGAEGARIVESD